jgi:uncharacterized protein YceK
MRRLLAPLAVCFALGACTMYNQPGTGPSAFDGTYTGTTSTTHSNTQGGVPSFACGAVGQATGSLVVQNGTVVWPNGGSTFYAPVARDGSFAAQNGQTFFSGKITNRAMVARGNISGCHTLYDLTKPA